MYLVQDYGNYWSATPESANYAYYLNCYSSGVSVTRLPRSEGYAVRLVQDIKYGITLVPGANGTLLSDVERCATGDKVTLTITPDAGYELGELTVTDANKQTITVAEDYSFVMPTADVTVTATFVKKPDTKEWVDLDLPSGLLWATCNVGASAPEIYGNHYAWGETEPKETYSWEAYQYGSSANALTKYCSDSNCGKDGFTDDLTTLEAEDDAAAVNWGGKWRMPTDAEWTELRENCDWIWTVDYNGTGIAGRIVASKTNGNSIFLPAAGFRIDDGLYLAGSYGGYWSSSLGAGGPNSACRAYFDSDDVNRESDIRRFGQSVRPVQDVVKYAVTVTTPENGTVTADKTEAAAGKTVTLTITPATGYSLDELTVTDANKQTITVAEDNSFVMPTADVTVTAVFERQTATAVQSAEMLELHAENGRIVCNSDIQIYDLIGRNVTHLNGSLKGVYIVRVGERAQKIVVRSK